MHDSNKLVLRGIIDAIGVFIYTSAVAWLMFNGERFFGKAESFWMPVALLLLFVLSAAITGLLVLGKPIILYLNDSKKEAFKLLIYTLVALFFILFVIFSVLLIK
jgi:hypothetical protein